MMQELAFPETTTSPNAQFDDYTCTRYGINRVAGESDVFIILFSRTDANGKHHYLVAERWPVFGSDRLVITNAKEFKHAKDRAYRYFEQRRTDLGAD